MDLSSIVKGLEGIGLSPLAIFFLLIWGFTLYTLKDAFSSKIKNFKFKTIFGPKYKYSIPDLVKHDLFNEVNLKKTSINPNFFTHGEPDLVKNMVFKDFIRCKMESINENMKKITKGITEETTRVDLKDHIHKCFSRCNDDLEQKLYQVFNEKNLSKEHAEVVINSFFEIRSKAMLKYYNRIDSLFSSDFYESNFSLILALYEIIAFELDDIIENSIETFDKINGMFKNLPYTP